MNEKERIALNEEGERRTRERNAERQARNAEASRKSAEAHAERFGRIHHVIEEALGGEQRIVVFSIDGPDDAQGQLRLLQEVPQEVRDRRVVLVYHDVHDEPPVFRSETLDAPTWLQIAVVANRMIVVTGCHNHFLTGLHGPVGSHPGPDGTPVHEFRLIMEF